MSETREYATKQHSKCAHNFHYECDFRCCEYCGLAQWLWEAPGISRGWHNTEIEMKGASSTIGGRRGKASDY